MTQESGPSEILLEVWLGEMQKAAEAGIVTDRLFVEAIQSPEPDVTKKARSVYKALRRVVAQKLHSLEYFREGCRACGLLELWRTIQVYNDAQLRIIRQCQIRRADALG